jgi:hypothetical protein
MNMPIDIYQLLNTLIQNKGINIRKLYTANKEILEENKIIIKNIYCKNVTQKGRLCLNKCIEGSKCCKIHDPIMRENRKKMNIRRREIKKMDKVEMSIEPSAPLLDDIKEDLPIYEQKPDESGLTIKNHIKNKDYHIKLNQSIIDNMAMEIENIKTHSLSFYKNIFINEGDIKSSNEIRPINIIESRNQVLLGINNVMDSRNNILPIVEKLLPINNGKHIISIEEYKNKLSTIDFNSINEQYKGLNLHKLYTNTIKLEMRLLYCCNNRPFNSKIITYINKFIKSIPK